VTSIGTSQSTVWFHDARGDRQITSEGYALRPSISPDGKKLYYLCAVDSGARGISWSEPGNICLHQGFYAPQYLPGSVP
jgi:hypothetical protein